jgi:hypothetical protein
MMMAVLQVGITTVGLDVPLGWEVQMEVSLHVTKISS